MSQETYVMLFDALTGDLLHPEVQVLAGQDTTTLNGPGDITFTLPVEWRNMKSHDGSRMIERRKTIAVARRPNGTVRAAGLVDDPKLSMGDFSVSCGGVSMLASQSGPWEGHQGWYTDIDPVTLFIRIWTQVQSYSNSNLGIKITGDTSSGSSVGHSGSARWRNANNQVNRLKPRLDKAEGHLLNAERVLSNRTERLFKAATLKRVGDVTQQEKEPDNPHYKRDSTIWVNNAWRAHVWREGQGWVPQSQADDAVYDWRNGVATRDRAKDRVDYLKYRIEPAQELLEKYEDEAREEFSTYFWQDHDMGKVIEALLELGPFEFRERAKVVDGKLQLEIQVGAPKVGVRRPELHLELGFNVHEHSPVEPEDLYTEVAQFGAGSGSEVLSQQRTWNPKGIVRNVLTDTDSDAHTKALVKAAANKNLAKIKKQVNEGFSALTITHGNACPEGSFEVGDQIRITGDLVDGTPIDGWYIVKEATHTWGSNETDIEVEPA